MQQPDAYGQILDEYEQEIEDNLTGNCLAPAQAAAKLACLKQAALNSLQKSEQINLRINAGDLIKLKNIAQSEGLKYQTFITRALHQLIVKYEQEAYK